MLSDRLRKNTGLEEVRAALAYAPAFGGAWPQAVELERLTGSHTNFTYKVTTEGGVYVVRLAGEGTSDYIDRATEEYNAWVAAATGVGAEVLYSDPVSGTMLSRFIEGFAVDEARLRREPEAVARTARALARIHRCGWTFLRRHDVFEEIEGYLDLLGKLGMPPPNGYDEVERDVEVIRRALQAFPVQLAPCHNDTWPGNFVDAGTHMYLVDWEFSGMNDPVWDLANLSVEASFTPEQDRAMMEAYLDRAAPPALYSRLELYKPVSDLHWTLWALVLHANGRPAGDFLSYAHERFKRCKRLMDAPDFDRHLHAVAHRL